MSDRADTLRKHKKFIFYQKRLANDISMMRASGRYVVIGGNVSLHSNRLLRVFPYMVFDTSTGASLSVNESTFVEITDDMIPRMISGNESALTGRKPDNYPGGLLSDEVPSHYERYVTIYVLMHEDPMSVSIEVAVGQIAPAGSAKPHSRPVLGERAIILADVLLHTIKETSIKIDFSRRESFYSEEVHALMFDGGAVPDTIQDLNDGKIPPSSVLAGLSKYTNKKDAMYTVLRRLFNSMPDHIHRRYDRDHMLIFHHLYSAGNIFSDSGLDIYESDNRPGFYQVYTNSDPVASGVTRGDILVISGTGGYWDGQHRVSYAFSTNSGGVIQYEDTPGYGDETSGSASVSVRHDIKAGYINLGSLWKMLMMTDGDCPYLYEVRPACISEVSSVTVDQDKTGTICSGSIITFTAQPTPPDPGTYTYSWSISTTGDVSFSVVSGCGPSDGECRVEATVPGPGDTGTINASVQVTDDCDPPNTASGSGADVTIDYCCEDITGVSISPTDSASVGETVTYTATPSPSSATDPITYTWNITGDATYTSDDVIGSPVEGQNSITVTWTGEGTATISVDATNCSSGSASDSITIGIGCDHVHNVTVTADKSSADINENIRFEVVAEGKQPFTYTWGYPTSGATVVSGGGSNDTYIVIRWSTSGTKTVTCQVDNDCPSSSSGSTSVAINPPPCIAISRVTISGGPSSDICSSSDNVSFTYNAVVDPSNATDVTYNWGVPSGCGASISTSNGGATATYTYHVNTSDNYCPSCVMKASVTASNSCSSASDTIVTHVLKRKVSGHTIGVSPLIRTVRLTYSGDSETFNVTISGNQVPAKYGCLTDRRLQSVMNIYYDGNDHGCASSGFTDIVTLTGSADASYTDTVTVEYIDGYQGTWQKVISYRFYYKTCDGTTGYSEIKCFTVMVDNIAQ